MADYTGFTQNNVAPYAASQIGVYNSSGTRVGTIPLNTFKPAYGERLYRFGVLSDVHNETDQADENQSDIRNALQYFNDKESVEFTVISGDLTQTSYSTGTLSTELALYKANLEAISNSTPVYPTTGNHDCPNSSDVDIDSWKSYTGTSDLYTSDATYSYEVTKTHETSDGKTITDRFLFLGMRRYEFTANTYLDADITWLGNKLESYKADRCFVITHMFFPDASGNFQQIYPSGNWLSGDQLASLKTLRANYPRVIWMNGHSHWKWYLQQYEAQANVWPVTNDGRTTAWCLHVPSCASPIDSNVGNSSLSSNRVSMSGQSEGAIIDVYENYVDVRAISFKDADDTTYTTKYLPIGQYRLYTAPGSDSSGGDTTPDDGYTYVTSSMVSLNPNKDDGLTFSVDDDTHTVTLNFTATSQGVIITDGNITSTDTVTVLFDSVEFSDDTAASTNKIGFYDSSSSYSLTSGLTASVVDNSAIQFNTSSSFVTNGGTVPVTATITNLRFKIGG